MPGTIPKGRPAKGARLFLRPASDKRQAVYVIRDGSTFRSTGCGPQNRAGAEEALQAYLAEKHDPRTGQHHPDAIPLADVLNLYMQDVVPGHARPDETANRINRLLDFEEWTVLSDVNGRTCRGYADQRTSIHSARRELEDLRAAIRYHLWEGQTDREIKVTLPAKAAPRQRWLTRSEAARALHHAWTYREVQRGKPTAKRSRRHLARLALVALYTGTRSGAITNASFVREEGRGFVDLETGIYERRPTGETQTKKRKPAIRIPPRLLAHMRRWHKNGQRYVVEYNGTPVASGKRAFSRVAKDAGLEGKVTLHTLRHTAATWAMMNGTKLWQAAGYLGMSIQTLEAVYGHHHPDRTAQAGINITRKPDGTEMAQKIPA